MNQAPPTTYPLDPRPLEDGERLNGDWILTQFLAYAEFLTESQAGEIRYNLSYSDWLDN